MSQLAENQSAIIENENNSNIVMESQAAMASNTDTMGDGSPSAADTEQETIQETGGMEGEQLGDQDQHEMDIATDPVLSENSTTKIKQDAVLYEKSSDVGQGDTLNENPTSDVDQGDTLNENPTSDVDQGDILNENPTSDVDQGDILNENPTTEVGQGDILNENPTTDESQETGEPLDNVEESVNTAGDTSQPQDSKEDEINTLSQTPTENAEQTDCTQAMEVDASDNIPSQVTAVNELFETDKEDGILDEGEAGVGEGGGGVAMTAEDEDRLLEEGNDQPHSAGDNSQPQGPCVDSNTEISGQTSENETVVDDATKETEEVSKEGENNFEYQTDVELKIGNCETKVVNDDCDVVTDSTPSVEKTMEEENQIEQAKELNEAHNVTQRENQIDMSLENKENGDSEKDITDHNEVVDKKVEQKDTQPHMTHGGDSNTEENDKEEEPVLLLTDIKSGAEAELVEKQDVENDTENASKHAEVTETSMECETTSTISEGKQNNEEAKSTDKEQMSNTDTAAVVEKEQTSNPEVIIVDKGQSSNTNTPVVEKPQTSNAEVIIVDQGQKSNSEKNEANKVEKKNTEEDDDDVKVIETPDPKLTTGSKAANSAPVDDDDVVVLDDDEVTPPKNTIKEEHKDMFNSSNDMGIQIASVSGGADILHSLAEQHEAKLNGSDQTPDAVKTEAKPVTPQSQSQTAKKIVPKVQTCIVCKTTGRCKYNIVRNGDIKHLCDDECFKRFRANPTMFLKCGGQATQANRGRGKTAAAAGTPAPKPLDKSAPQSCKMCAVCQNTNVGNQGQFCNWKGMDFCGEGCLGKFQAGISTTCAMCKSFIPLTARSANCLRLGNEIRPFCGSQCCNDYKQNIRLCTFCQKNLASAPDSFSAPVGSDSSFKDFCSHPCMKKFEEQLSTEVEVVHVEHGTYNPINKCSVCQKNEKTKHAIKYSGVLHTLCSDPCMSAFRYANKLNTNACDTCNTICATLDSTPHTVVYEGVKKRFCSDTCVTQYRVKNKKVVACSWCGSQRDNFDMIERLDASSKYQLFCSLNCLSLFRVNLQAKSNQAVTCDQCMKCTPAQYHLTMSDATVRNFCSYTCVLSFQSQYTKATAPTPPAQPPQPAKHKHNTRGKNANKSPTTSQAGSIPIISNVISLAPQGSQTVNIKNSSGAQVLVTGNTAGTKTPNSQTRPGLVQQKIIIQPPMPPEVRNKALLCKPLTQTKATSCRPHAIPKECQTDEVKQKPVLVPVPVPIYLPAPMALYSAPTPTPIFIPIPIPVPIFIPTTRKSAAGIMKQIKEIQEKTPSDPLEAELLMMAAAVSGDTKNSSDSDSDADTLPPDDTPINRPMKRPAPADDDDDDDGDADVMPLCGRQGEGGEEDMISMALRMAEEMSGPITDLESAVEAVPVNPDPTPVSETTEDTSQDLGTPRNTRNASRRRPGRPKRARVEESTTEQIIIHPEPSAPPDPPADLNYRLKFTYGVNAWRHWVMLKNAQIEKNMKAGGGRMKLFKTDILQCPADELNFALCLFVKEVRKPSGDEYSPDSVYYLTLGIQQYLFENGRIDNLFADHYYERFVSCLAEILSGCQPKFNSAGQMVCRIEEEHLWECKQLGAHSPYVLLNTLIYFHTKYFMLKTPEEHMKLSFAHILKYWKKGAQPGKVGQVPRMVSLRYYSVSTARKDGSASTSTTKKGSKDGIPVHEVSENQDNPLRCPVKLYEFFLSKCPESIKNRSDIFYPVPERSCVPDSPVWYSTSPISLEVMTTMLTRTLLVREIQEAHLHAQPIFV